MTRMQVMHLEKISIFATYDDDELRIEHWDIVDFCRLRSLFMWEKTALSMTLQMQGVTIICSTILGSFQLKEIPFSLLCEMQTFSSILFLSVFSPFVFMLKCSWVVQAWRTFYKLLFSTMYLFFGIVKLLTIGLSLYACSK